MSEDILELLSQSYGSVMFTDGPLETNRKRILQLAFEEIKQLRAENERLHQKTKQQKLALEIALHQLELLGGKARKYPQEYQDMIHAEVLEQIDAVLKS